MTSKTTKAKALIITEKPSVARDIVAALGGFTARDGQSYWESDQYVCTFAVGHLFSLLAPEDLDPAYRSWKLSLLPILPADFRLKPISGQEKRIKVIHDLLMRDDVNCLINACDAAREGELIFREIVSYHDSRKWVRRLWLQSMTPEAIRAGFASLRDGTDLEGLGDAAECRARADWLIGMNATRAFSERLRSRGERTPWSVGRVQTPTLALLVERELKILGHMPKPFFKVVATFKAKDHDYEGTWFDPKFKADDARPDLKDDRIDGKAAADAVLEAIGGQPALASETREESQRHAPYLFNLTGLQKYMATRYKFNSKRTLEAAQRCYEQHKVLTYPRTNSSCLPSDYRPEVDRLIDGFLDDPAYAEAARFLKKNGRLNEKRTFNDQGVDDHFAIIPTGKARSLSGDDAKVYDAVVRRFLATFFPPAIYDKVKRTTVVAQQHFRTGPVETLAVPGWLSVYDKKASNEDGATSDSKLPPLVAGAKKAQDVGVRLADARLKEEVTRPPPRINEAGLLTLMEHAGRQVENEELAQALMSAEGLGTAATRADIIQNLKAKEYIDEALRPTFKGIHLITTLQRIKAERLTSPELTARLELELSEVEHGKRKNTTFMEEIARYTSEVVAVAKAFDLDRLYGSDGPLGLCPQCGKYQIQERALDYACGAPRQGPGIPEQGCGFRLSKEVAGRYLDRANASVLVTEGETLELEGFRRSGKGRTGDDGNFKARLRLANGRLKLVAGGVEEAAPEAPQSGDQSSPRQGGSAGPRSGGAPVGRCPMHKDPECKVIEAKSVFVCETRLKQFSAGDKQPVGILIPKVLCKREMRPEDLEALLGEGRTPELAGFVSKAGRPFKAALSLRPDGGCAFEFSKERSEAPGRKYPPRNPYPQRRAKEADT